MVVAPIRPGFSLQKMGAPEEAAARFLRETVAPEGSGRTAQLLGAGSRRDASGELYYQQEFTVQSKRFSRRNLSGECLAWGTGREGGREGGHGIVANQSFCGKLSGSAWRTARFALTTMPVLWKPFHDYHVHTACLQSWQPGTGCCTHSTARAQQSGGPATRPRFARRPPRSPSSTLVPPLPTSQTRCDALPGVDHSLISILICPSLHLIQSRRPGACPLVCLHHCSTLFKLAVQTSCTLTDDL